MMAIISNSGRVPYITQDCSILTGGKSKQQPIDLPDPSNIHTCSKLGSSPSRYGLGIPLGGNQRSARVCVDFGTTFGLGGRKKFGKVEPAAN